MLGAQFGQRPRLGPGSPPLHLFTSTFNLSLPDPASNETKQVDPSSSTGFQGRKGGDGEEERKQALEKEYSRFTKEFESLLWLTYRSGFRPMVGGYTTDTGWGCMLRSAQMMLAEALLRHLSSSSSSTSTCQKREATDDGTYREHNPASEGHRHLIRWFLDAPKYFAFYSIHRMTDCGRQYGKLPGEWYGPNTAALVLRDLVLAHRQRHRLEGKCEPKFLAKDFYSLRNEKDMLDLCVLVTDDSATLYLDEVEVITVPSSPSSLDSAVQQGGTPSTHDPLINPANEVAWTSSLLLIVPVRLGLHSLNEEYVGPLLEALRFPQCVGMIGGKPAHSLYFVGSQGRDLLYLDPHTVQAAASEDQCNNEFFPFQQDVDTYHCRAPRLIDAKSIDPSLAIGFFCRDRACLRDLISRLGQLHTVGTPFMAVAQSRPQYDFSDSEQEEGSDDEFRDDGEEEDEFFDAVGGADDEVIPDREDFVFL